MAYIETRPKSCFWNFSFVADKKRCRGSTGIIARENVDTKKLINRRKAQDFANALQRFFKDRNADGLIMLGQKKLADKVLKVNYAEQTQHAIPFDKAFKDFLETYTTDRLPSVGYLELLQKYYLKHFKTAWRFVADVSEASISQYKKTRLDVVKQNTLHKELVVLHQFLEWCKKEGHIAIVPQFTLPSGKSMFKARPPTRAEVEIIFARLPDWKKSYGINKQHRPVREFFTFLYFQALRWGSVEKAEWSDIFVEDDRWYFRIRAEIDKSRYDRVVPLHKRSVEALLSLGIQNTGLIFGAHDYRRILCAVLKGIGFRHIRMHDFRHARIDELVQRTRDISGVQFLAGHKDLKTTQHYMHPDTKRVERIFDEEES